MKLGVGEGAEVDGATGGVEDPDLGDAHVEEIADADHGAGDGVFGGEDFDAEEGRGLDHLFLGRG